MSAHELHTPDSTPGTLIPDPEMDPLTAAQIAAGELGLLMNDSSHHFSDATRQRAAELRNQVGRLVTIANSGVRFPEDPPPLH